MLYISIQRAINTSQQLCLIRVIDKKLLSQLTYSIYFSIHPHIIFQDERLHTSIFHFSKSPKTKRNVKWIFFLKFISFSFPFFHFLFSISYSDFLSNSQWRHRQQWQREKLMAEESSIVCILLCTTSQ